MFNIISLFVYIKINFRHIINIEVGIIMFTAS